MGWAAVPHCLPQKPSRHSGGGGAGTGGGSGSSGSGSNGGGTGGGGSGSLTGRRSRSASPSAQQEKHPAHHERGQKKVMPPLRAHTRDSPEASRPQPLEPSPSFLWATVRQVGLRKWNVQGHTRPTCPKRSVSVPVSCLPRAWYSCVPRAPDWPCMWVTPPGSCHGLALLVRARVPLSPRAVHPSSPLSAQLCVPRRHPAGAGSVSPRRGSYWDRLILAAREGEGVGPLALRGAAPTLHRTWLPPPRVMCPPTHSPSTSVPGHPSLPRVERTKNALNRSTRSGLSPLPASSPRLWAPLLTRYLGGRGSGEDCGSVSFSARPAEH